MGKPKKKFNSRSRAAKKALRLGKQPHQRRGKDRHGKPNPVGGDKLYVGEIQKNPRGFAFVLSRDENREDVFLPPEEARSLVQGDVIEYRVKRRGQRLSGEVVRIVKRVRKKAFGALVHENHQWILHTREGDWYIAKPPRESKHSSLSEGWAIGDIERYPSREKPGLAIISEYFGTKLLPRHDNAIAMAEFGLESEFSEDASAEALFSRRVKPDLSQRKDHRALPFVTIDGEDAKDFDDAILVETNVQGAAYVLYVAIADVSYYVKEGGALDLSARSRGTSVYFPGFVIPMLPETLSNDLCSLRPNVERLALTAEIRFDKNGDILATDFYEAVIQTHGRLTYNEVQKFWDGDADVQKKLEHVREPLKRAKELYRILDRQRKERGVLDFQLPESKLELDPSGKPLKVFRAPRYDSHKLIEEFMIKANQVVAIALNDAEEPALHRVHEQPKETALMEINQMLKSFGVLEQMKDLSPQSFARILEVTKPLKQAGTLHQFILRTQKQAKYMPEPLGHFGLALQDYAHFTSPIRRYPDLVVHRALKRVINAGISADKDKEELWSEMETLGQETSDRERKAMEAERFVTRRKQCWFMKERVGDTYPGRVSGVISRGLFIELGEFAIDGFIPIEKLGGSYVFDEAKHCLRRRPGHSVISIGDNMDVQVVKVSLEEHEITLGLPGQSERDEEEDSDADFESDD